MRLDRLSARAPREGMAWGSDAVAETLAALGLPYIAMTPGSSYRGLHDSLVNHLGNRSPALVLCLHEEHAVALAHGYAKVAQAPLAVGLHSNVGLMHAVMAIYNAFCDRVPMLVLGATGPVDASERRPWIDWLHTAADQGALIRSYTKWDDQPGSAAAAVESVLRAHALTRSHPCAPTYVNLDVSLQEAPLREPLEIPPVARFAPAPRIAPARDGVERAAQLLRAAERPLILAGRVGAGEDAWDARIALAERLGACVLTDLKLPATFPTAHRLHGAAPGTFLPPGGRELLARADVVLSLDWVDLAGTLAQGDASSAQVISVSLDHTLHNGWSKDHFALPPVDLHVPAHPDLLVDALTDALGAGGAEPWFERAGAEAAADGGGELTIRLLAAALADALDGSSRCLVRLPLGWDGADLEVAHPLDYLGQDGGAGVGSGPGMAVGAALALAGSGRIPVAVLGDGDFLMGSSALWTAAHYGLPLLVLVANNGSFFNDEVHQQRVAERRGRPVENRWIGQHIRDPRPDLAAIARGLGLEAFGPVENPQALAGTLAQAVERVVAGAAVVVDVAVSSAGYPGSGGVARAAAPAAA